MTNANPSEKMLKWQVGLLASLLGAFLVYVAASVPWAMGVNKELGGIHQSLKEDERQQREIDALQQQINDLQKLVYERLK